VSNEDLFVNKGNNLLVVDCLNLCFRFKHERYKTDGITAPEWATLDDLVEVMREELEDKYFFSEYVNTVESLARSYKATKIILVGDLGGSTWRKNLYPEYKGDRAEKYALEPLVNQAASKVFMEHYKRLLQDLEDYEGIDLVVEYGVEADDLATYLVLNHSDKYEHTWLVSSDEDWDLLIRDNVSRFNWMCKTTWKNVTKTGPRPKEV
jgi:5'-3' exonuclease